MKKISIILVDSLSPCYKEAGLSFTQILKELFALYR